MDERRLQELERRITASLSQDETAAEYGALDELIAEVRRLRDAHARIIDRAEYRMGSQVSDDVVAIAREVVPEGGRASSRGEF